MMDKWIRRIADIATALVALVVLILVLRAAGGWTDSTPEPVDVQLNGAELGIEFAGHAATLIMVLDSECQFCTASMPFYRRLLGLDRSEVQVVVAAASSDPDIGTYIADEGLDPDSLVFVASSQALPASVTPTLLLADSSGVVMNAWFGMLSPDSEDEVLSIVR